MTHILKLAGERGEVECALLKTNGPLAVVLDCNGRTRVVRAACLRRIVNEEAKT